MNTKRIVTAALAAVVFSSLVACTDNSNEGNAGGSTNDTNLTDTRRNSGDTGSYMAHDSANQMKVQPDGQ